MKIIHTADWQLGKHFARFEPDVRAALTEARFDAIDAIGRQAQAHGVNHVLVAGDIFDTEGPEDRTVVQALSRMERHPCRWWLLPGNHDFARNGGLWDRVKRRAGANITSLTEPEPCELEDGVWLLPAPLAYRHNLDDPTDQFDQMDTPGAKLRIGLAHGSIRDFGSQGETKNQIAIDRARRSKLDYLALGDWHGALKVDGAADQMTLDIEGVVDRRVGGEELLSRGLGFEALLLSLSSSDRQVGVFDPVVLS